MNNDHESHDHEAQAGTALAAPHRPARRDAAGVAPHRRARGDHAAEARPRHPGGDGPDEQPLDEALGPSSRCFDYLYDFGDDRHRVVTVEDLFLTRDTAKPPVYCTDGARACPPEDVGGAGGYEDFLAGLADPQHEEHRNCLAWVGGRFDPFRFDLDEVNGALARIKA